MRQRHVAISALMLVGSLSLAGCSSTHSTATPTGCATDADCNEGKKCNSASKQCVECIEDSQCGAGKVCMNNTCQANPLDCSADPDCPANSPHCDIATNRCVECESRSDCAKGKICQNGACTADVCSTCTAGQFCFNGEKCLAKGKTCAAHTDCGADEACLIVGGTQQCIQKCNPGNNTSSTDMHNQGCMNGYGICMQYNQPSDGACLPPLDNSRDLLELCWNLGHPETDGYNDCKAGLLCMGRYEGPGNCWKACDPTKNTGGAGQTGPNPACETGSYCVPDGHGGGGCDPRKLTRATGETCNGANPSKPDFDHCVANNQCLAYAEGLSLCTLNCDPSSATNTCGADHECLLLSPNDPTAGGCIKVRKPTRNTGETCRGDDPRIPGWNDCVDALTPCIDHVCGPKRTTTQTLGQGCEKTDSTGAEYNACATGLTCYQNKCATSCAKTDASACAETEFCYITTHAGAGICRSQCDTANGIVVTTECPAGMYCTSNTTTYKPGYCLALPAFTQGTAQQGESCSGALCDGSKGLTCSATRCRQACDPHQGIATNAACATGESCFEAVTSPLGGVCKAAATQGLGEACSTTLFCKNGLYCDFAVHTCARTCNPANNTAMGNPGCDANHTCQSSGAVLAGGYCQRAPQPTREAGETCLATDPTKPEFDDCVTGLVCNVTKKPQVCVPPLGHFAQCGWGYGVCAPQDICQGSPNVGVSYCFERCAVGGTTCPASFECVPYSKNDPTAGGCVQTCTAVAECTTYGTTCSRLGGSTNKYCL